jgi:hypothetical protein
MTDTIVYTGNRKFQQVANDSHFERAKDGMDSYEHFIHSIIREHARHESDGYVLYADQLPLADQKLFLSHLLAAEDYEDALSSPIRCQEYIKENLSDMQAGIDLHLNEVYREDMEEMGLHFSQRNNGDVLLVRT